MTTSVIRDSNRPVALRVRELTLEVLAGPAAGRRARMSKRELSVGSHASNDLVIDDPAISRFHFRIVADEKGHRIIDAGSTNGTVVSGIVGQRIASRPYAANTCFMVLRKRARARSAVR